MERLWGSMKPIPEERVRPVSGGETLRIGKQKISVIYTPGHASHHVSYLLDDGSLFAGDALGIRLSGFPVIRPALPPPEVDIELWDASLNSIVIVEPKRFLLTHFGEVLDVGQHLNQLRAQNHLWADAILKGMKAGETRYELQRRIHGLSNLDLSKAGADAELADCYNDSSNAEMTVMGLSRYWRKRCPSLPGGDP
jgi:glyoxylase-like metal-dependent hydrolase (beta-lactamase superfamily II)